MNEADAPAKPRAKIGRPRIIDSPEEMRRRTDAYEQWCEDNSEPITITGLCRFMGFSSRDALGEYEKRGAGFADAVKRARLMVEHSYERRLDRDRPTGAIFGLKNFGWSDRMDVNFRGILANLDIGRLTDEEIARLAGGESAMSVLSQRVAPAGLLPAGPPEPPKDPA